MKTTKTIAALALTALAGASLVGCSTITETASAPEPVSIKVGAYVHTAMLGDDLEQRLVVLNDDGDLFLSTYNCQGQKPVRVNHQSGTIDGEQIIFTDADGTETGRSELWQAHTKDPETGEADLNRPLNIIEVDGTTFQKARSHVVCD